MSFLSNLFDPGRGDRSNASMIANSAGAQITGGTARGPFDILGAFGFVGPDQRFTSRARLGDLQPAANALVRTAKNNIGHGATNLGFLGEIMRGSMADLGGSAPQSMNFRSSLGRLPSSTGPNIMANAPESMSGFSGLGSIFSSALPVANADPFALGADVTANLREQALPGQQRAVNSAMDRLFASGRLGTTGGAQAMEALANAQNQQDLQFQLAGLEAGRGLQSDAMARAISAFGGNESMAGRMFGESLAGEQLRTGTALSAEQLAQGRMFGVENAAQGRDALAMQNLSRMFGERLAGGQFEAQNAMSRFGMGTSMADALLQNLVTGNNIGISSIGAATGLAQLPLAFQQMALQANIARSNANLSRAGVQQVNASMAKSPLLEGINAIGQFFNPINFPGTGGGGGGGSS